MVIISRLFCLSPKADSPHCWMRVDSDDSETKQVGGKYYYKLQLTAAQPERCPWGKQMGCSDGHSLRCLRMKSLQSRSASLRISRLYQSYTWVHIHTLLSAFHVPGTILSWSRMLWYEKRHHSCPPRASSLLKVTDIYQIITTANIQL